MKRLSPLARLYRLTSDGNLLRGGCKLVNLRELGMDYWSSQGPPYSLVTINPGGSILVGVRYCEGEPFMTAWDLATLSELWEFKQCTDIYPLSYDEGFLAVRPRGLFKLDARSGRTLCRYEGDFSGCQIAVGPPDSPVCDYVCIIRQQYLELLDGDFNNIWLQTMPHSMGVRNMPETRQIAFSDDSTCIAVYRPWDYNNPSAYVCDVRTGAAKVISYYPEYAIASVLTNHTFLMCHRKNGFVYKSFDTKGRFVHHTSTQRCTTPIQSYWPLRGTGWTPMLDVDGLGWIVSTDGDAQYPLSLSGQDGLWLDSIETCARVEISATEFCLQVLDELMSELVTRLEDLMLVRTALAAFVLEDAKLNLLRVHAASR